MQTLLCGNVTDEQWAQVTAAGVRLVAASTKQCSATWAPSAGAAVNVAAASPSQVVLAVGGRTLVLLSVGPASLQEVGRLELEHEVSCLDVTPLAGPDAESASLVAVGSWDMRCSLYSLPDLQQLASEVVGTEVIPRSVQLASFENGCTTYLLVAMGDGHLVNFKLDPATGILSERKNVSLGTKPVTLTTFNSGGARHVFAASDRPTVIYANNGKLLYSNLNENEVNLLASFNSAPFPDCLAIAKEGELTIGSIDDIQRLHVRTVPLGEQPRRIAHQEATRTFAVTTTQNTYGAGGDDCYGADYVRLISDQTFETLARHRMDPYEMCCSIASMSMADDPQVYYVVGTAYAKPDEEEPTQGRILLFAVRDSGSRLELVAEKDTRGAVFVVLPFQGKLLACVNSKVQLYQWVAREVGGQGPSVGGRELAGECGHSGLVMALFAAARGDSIVVGDLMKSMQLLVYKPEEGALHLRATDYHNNWMTAVEVLDDDTYVGAENSCNLFVVRRNSDSASDEERNRLDVVGEYNLGEMVNRFRRGSLVMQLPDSDASRLPQLLFGTINGVLGVMASLPRAQFEFLDRLQRCLRTVVNGVGGLSHEAWRTFSNDSGTRPARGFIDGDLIEQYLDLSRPSMEKVAAEMGSGVTADEVYRVVEELSRLH